ncbi:hypothetical protein VRB68_02720 [Pseudomonas trivialis]|uniref:hypothetical protein n=1 Tax=Pseudomonas trivialis TaxID=200450 RepID=UPI0030CE6777
MQEPILSGRLTPSEFVYRVADAGELEVLRTGGLWDVPGIVGPQWVPHAWRQRTLGLAFATADDAARHAHEQVGDRREQDHAALILQREDGRFVVTDPLVAKGARFALDTVYSSQEHSALQGYKLHGLFASRGRTAKPRQWSGAQAEVFTQMFSDDDIYRLLTQRKTVDLAYLSGSRNSLLRFVSDGLTTGAEQELLGQVSPGDGSSAVALEWAQGTRLPSEFVQTLAFTSHLTVLVGSALWGAPVDLSGDWEPYGADRWSVLPAVPMTGAMCASAQEAVLQAHGRVADRYASEVAGMGLLLKHQTLEQYVATQRVPADQLNLLAQRCENALPLSSAGFVVDSVYYSSRRVSAGASEQARWLHRHFLAPAELFAALYKSAGERRFALTRPAVVHIACLDGAVLHYAYSAGSRLFQLAPGRDSPAVLEHDLMHGALSARDYVVKVAGQGQLTVNLSSECWDEDGLVGPHWQPFAHITPRYLSPAFATADDAVRYVHRILGKRRDQVYGGLVLKGVGGGYVVTEPLAVHVEDFDPQWVRLHALVETGQFLGGSSIVACYHTRAPSRGGLSVSTQEQAVYEGMFSTHFLQAVLGNEAWPQTASPRTDYLLCHDGALLRFRVNGTAHPSILADDVEQRLRNGVLLPSEWVRRVAAAGDLQVLEGSPLWGVPQKVMAAWTPYPEEQDPWLSPAVQADLPMSPLFAQINDAVRYAHRQAGERQSRVFGWVLKVPGNLYMVSQPTPLWGRRSIDLDHLFEGGVLPAGYFVIGVYLCTQAPEAQASAEEVRSSFLLPLDLQLGLSAAMQPGAAHGTGVLLFISCTDGALLKLDHFRPDNDLLHGADRYDARVRKGDVSTADYVHKVARTGALKVLVPSEFWSARGVVSQQWQPFQSAGLSQQQDNRLDLGPLCLQPDDAARHAQQWVRDQPDKAWLGGVLTHSRLGAVAIEPLLDTQTPSVAEQRLFWTSGRNATAPEPLPVPELPEGFEVTAAHHFYKSDMPAEEGPLQANFISWTYLFNYTRRLRRFGLPVTCYYLSTRDGALLKYTVDSSVGSHQNEMVESFRHLGTYTAAYLLDQLMTDKSLTVVQTGSFWQRRGPVVAPAKSSPAANTPVLLRERDEF